MFNLPLTNAFLSLSAGNWVDIAFIFLILGFMIFDAIRGFSTTIATVFGLLIGAHAGYWLFPQFHRLTHDSSLAAKSGIFATVLPYLLTILTGIVFFILTRLLFRKFFVLLVEQPADRILGAVAGMLKGVLAVIFVISCASLFPKGSNIYRIFCVDSASGRMITPTVQKILLGEKQNDTSVYISQMLEKNDDAASIELCEKHRADQKTPKTRKR